MIQRSLRDETRDIAPIGKYARAHGRDVGGSQCGGSLASHNLHRQIKDVGSHLHPERAAAPSIGCYNSTHRAPGLSQQRQVMCETVTYGFQNRAIEVGSCMMQHHSSENTSCRGIENWCLLP